MTGKKLFTEEPEKKTKVENNEESVEASVESVSNDSFSEPSQGAVEFIKSVYDKKQPSIEPNLVCKPWAREVSPHFNLSIFNLIKISLTLNNRFGLKLYPTPSFMQNCLTSWSMRCMSIQGPDTIMQ